jgi:hypothetical protein
MLRDDQPLFHRLDRRRGLETKRTSGLSHRAERRYQPRPKAVGWMPWFGDIAHGDSRTLIRID